MNRLFTLSLLALLGPVVCAAQNSITPLPPNYKTILETRSFKVIRVHYGPHEKVPVHDHPDTPTVYVYLNNSSPVRLIHEENRGKPFTIVRPPTQKGAFRVSPGSIERHSVENLGDIESNFLRVELPGLRLGDHTLEFRGQAPADLSHDLSAVEFSSPRLTVRRTICADNSPCSIAPSPASSVIVALSGSTISNAGRKTTLGLGDVKAIAPHQSLLLSPTDAGPAHILQILVPGEKWSGH